MRDAIALSLENERLQLALRARLEEQQALRRVATAVAQQHEPVEIFELVTREVARHLDADAAMTARYDGPGLATVLADWAAPGVAAFPTGRQIVIGGPTALAQVQATRAPGRVDSYEGMPGEYPAELRALGMRASVAAPVIVGGELWGAVAAGSAGAPFTSDTEARLGAFAELVGQAIANVDARMQLTESRARLVAAADDARRRIERDLHDGAQQRLVALALSLGVVAKNAEPATAAAVEACIRELHIALDELRELARGIHPVLLTERGLEPALRALASRSPIPVRVDASLDERLPPAQEAALYYVAAEALTNVAKHAAGGRDRRPARRGPTAGRRSRSPTTASAARSSPTAAACAASSTASTRSAAASRSPARRRRDDRARPDPGARASCGDDSSSRARPCRPGAVRRRFALPLGRRPPLRAESHRRSSVSCPACREHRLVAREVADQRGHAGRPTEERRRSSSMIDPPTPDTATNGGLSECRGTPTPKTARRRRSRAPTSPDSATQSASRP